MYEHEQGKKAGQPVQAAEHKAGMSTQQELGLGLGTAGVLAAGAAAYGVRPHLD